MRESNEYICLDRMRTHLRSVYSDLKIYFKVLEIDNLQIDQSNPIAVNTKDYSKEWRAKIDKITSEAEYDIIVKEGTSC